MMLLIVESLLMVMYLCISILEFKSVENLIKTIEVDNLCISILEFKFKNYYS